MSRASGLRGLAHDPHLECPRPIEFPHVLGRHLPRAYPGPGPFHFSFGVPRAEGRGTATVNLPLGWCRDHLFGDWPMSAADRALSPGFTSLASAAENLVSGAIARRADCSSLQVNLREMTAEQVCALGAAMNMIGRALEILDGLPPSIDGEPANARLTPGRRVVIVTPFVMPQAVAFPGDGIVIED